MQPVNLLTNELQLCVEESNSYHFLKKKSEKSYLFFTAELSLARSGALWVRKFGNLQEILVVT